MDDDRDSGTTLDTGWYVRKAMIFGFGGLLTCAGILIGGVAVASAARDWARQLDRAPSDAAVALVKRVSAVTSAGADEWQKHSASSS